MRARNLRAAPCFTHSGIAMNLSSPKHQKLTVAADLHESRRQLPAGQPFVHHQRGVFSLATQCNPRLAAGSNDMNMPRPVIVR
jgi:hypothetical protein